MPEREILRTILWFLYFWIYLIKILPQYNFAKKIKNEWEPEKLLQYVHNVVKTWAESLLKVAGVETQVHGLENIPKGGALFVSNHQGNFDIPILLGKLDEPKSIVAKIELEKMPMISSWMKLFNCLFIDRKNPRQCMKILGEAEHLLSQGQSVIIFPEGTRSKGRDLGEFKDGAFRTALKSKVPIVPIVIDGSYKIMEANGGWIKPGCVNLTILPPVITADLSKEQGKNIGEQIKAAIEQTLMMGTKDAE